MRKKSNLLRAAHWSDCGPLRFVILSRLSDDEQAIGADTSLDAQERLAKAMVTRYIAQFGGQLVRCVRGEKSGTTLKRSDWREVIALAEDRAFDVLVSVRMDRVGRGATYSVAEHLLSEEKVAIWVTEDHFAAGAGGKVMKAAYLFRDGAYAAFVGEAVRSHQRDAVMQGYWPGGLHLYGTATVPAPGMSDTALPGGKVRKAPRVVVAEPEQIQHVEQALRLVVKHRSLSPAVEYLRSATGNSWSVQNVRRVLASPVLVGEIHWGEFVNERAHEPLVPVELWQQAAQILAQLLESNQPRERKGKVGQMVYHRQAPIDGDHLLRGLVRCAHCNCFMSCSWATGKSGRVNYYECAHARAYKGTCPVRRVNAQAIEEALLEELFRTFAHPWRMRRWMEAAGALLSGNQQTQIEDEMRLTRRNLKEARRKSTNLVAAIKSAGSVVEALPPLVSALADQEKIRERLEARLEELSTSLRSSRRRISAAVACRAWQDLPQTWELASTEEKRLILASLVEQIELTGRDENTREIQGRFGLIVEAPAPSPETMGDCGSVDGGFEKEGSGCTRSFALSNLTLPVPLRLRPYRRARKGSPRVPVSD